MKNFVRSTYKPSDDLLEGIRNMFPMETLPWDDYYMRMAQADYLLNRHNLKASKTFFIRKAPFGGSFAVLGGLTAFLRVLKDYTFNNLVCDALLEQGYKKDFVNELFTMDHLNISVYVSPEGSIFMPNEPAIILEGNLLNVRIVEGILLKNINFPTLSMTKWARVAQAAFPGMVMEFARRRAQDDLRTTLYAHLAGANITSNAEIRCGFNIPVKGTHGHEWVQSFGDEFEAFDKWLEINPDRPVLLVDTIDTLKSGLPNAIKAFKKHWDSIKNAGGIPGIRNDSGDLAYITLEERIALDKEDLKDVIIYETNDLDEHSIESIKQQIFTHAPRAGLDPYNVIQRIIWACGTQPGTCSDQPSLGGVAKLSTVEYWKQERPVIKLAKDNPIKTSIPGSNRSTWIRDNDNNGELLCCVIHDKLENASTFTCVQHPDDESKRIILQHMKHLTFHPRQKLVFVNGEILHKPTLEDVRSTVKKELLELHWTYKRLLNPHAIKVSLSENLFELRKRMISNSTLMDK